jgi:hypothetical protein
MGVEGEADVSRQPGGFSLPLRAWGAHDRHRDAPIPSTSWCPHTPCYTAVVRGSGRARYVRMSSFILSNSNK